MVSVAIETVVEGFARVNYSQFSRVEVGVIGVGEGVVRVGGVGEIKVRIERLPC